MRNTKFTTLLFAFLALGACGKADAPKDANLENAVNAAQQDAQDTLKVGHKAPDFNANGALAGKDFSFKLSEKLKEGPLVLYFFPKAFTPGCTLEAHDFSDTTEEFKKYGATVIGMSGDNIDALKKFSTEECRDKFAVATATPEIAKAFHVDMMQGITKRTTFVIAQDGTISMIYENSDYRNHVTNALEQVKELSKLK